MTRGVFSYNIYVVFSTQPFGVLRRVGKVSLDARKRSILASVIRAYIETGEPVGSKSLISRENLGLSSATVRNEMNELEKEGLIQKPHTSAGRIPTNEGYRFYVSNALSEYELSPYETAVLERAFARGNTMEDTLREMTAGMAKFSGCTVFTIAPMCGDGRFSYKVFASGKKTVGIMAVSSENSVKTCFTKTYEEASASELLALESLLCERFFEISDESLSAEKLKSFKRDLPEIFSGVYEYIERFLFKLRNFDLYIEGASNLFAYPEFSEMETARRFMNFINEEEEIKKILLDSFYSNSISIRIGEENKLFPTASTSVISVGRAGKFPLVIGVMGPTRMYYSRIISGCNHLLREMSRLWGEN